MRSPSRSHPRPRPPAPRPEPNQAETHLEAPELPADATPPPEDIHAVARPPKDGASSDMSAELRDSYVLTRTIASAPYEVIERPAPEAPAAEAAQKVPADARGPLSEARDVVVARLADVKAFVAARLPEPVPGEPGVVAKLAAEIKARVAAEDSDGTRAHLLALVKQFHVGMLVTKAPDGAIHARPMAVADLDADGNLWFVTDQDSAKVEEIASDQDVSVLFQSDAASVAITGRASLTTDTERIRQLWSEAWRVWFPDGPGEADLVLVRVDTTRGEYWDQRGGSRLRYLFDAARAYVKGEKLHDAGDGTHGTATLA